MNKIQAIIGRKVVTAAADNDAILDLLRHAAAELANDVRIDVGKTFPPSMGEYEISVRWVRESALTGSDT